MSNTSNHNLTILTTQQPISPATLGATISLLSTGPTSPLIQPIEQKPAPLLLPISSQPIDQKAESPLIRTIEPSPSSSFASHRHILNSFLIGLSLPVLLYLVYSSSLGYYFRAEYLQHLKDELPYWHIILPILFWVFGTCSIGLGMPRLALSLLAGNLFGFWAGLGLVELTCVTGALITFSYSRWIRRTWLAKPLQGKIFILDRYIQQHSIATILVLRQTPAPGFVINVLLGLSAVRIKDFIAASAIGFLPQNIVFVLYGCGMQQNFGTHITIASSLLIILAILIYYVYHHLSFAQNLIGKLAISANDKKIINQKN